MNTIVTYNTLKFTKIDFTENSELSDQIQFLENMPSEVVKSIDST